MVEAGQRWEFIRGMYGNVYEVIDNQRFRWYRQDRPVDGQIDLFEGSLPFKCDYCGNIVDQISWVNYKCVYWYLTRPKLPNPAWKRTDFVIKFACCSNCKQRELPIPKDLIGYHMTELYQDGIKVFEQERRL
ncbi:hypothetical protein [Paenibacillus lentus]|uniref:hypothetical protein n=1 Tax=Paenibacillus lentus TaxID=1338368 RepID=UPI0036D37044